MEKKAVLRLNMVKMWYDLILSGFKKEEYRDDSDYYHSRLYKRKYDMVEFINGYHPGARRMCFEVIEIKLGKGNPDWGGDPNYDQWVIVLGKKLWVKD